MTDTSTPAPRGILLGQRLVIGFVIAGLVILADQVVKLWLMGLVLEPRRSIGILDADPFLVQILPIWNRGVSFGMLAGEWGLGWLAGPPALAGFAILISLLLLIWMLRAERTILLISLALVLGGAVGNVIDRVRYGAVFDFLDFAINGWHPFVFNLADAAITFGVILLLWDSLFGAGRATK